MEPGEAGLTGYVTPERERTKNAVISIKGNMKAKGL